MTVAFIFLVAFLFFLVVGAQVLYRAFGRPSSVKGGSLATDEHDPDAEDDQILWIGSFSGSPMMNRSVGSRAQYLNNMGTRGRL